jgi:beta-lactamase superfamily II metal-dependent hydrolase
MGIADLNIPSSDQIEVSVFGPSFGESVVVHYGGGKWLIVDSCVSPGSKEPVALEYLNKIGVECDTVQFIFITHWHSDHIGGAAKLVEKCANAKICIPASFTKSEFISFLAGYNDPTQASLGNGVDEIVEIFSLVKNRTRALASADKRIGVDEIITDSSSHRCEIWTLSPSDLEITESLAQLGSLIPTHGTAKRRATPTGKNDNSIVVLIEVGGTSVLLGADLEETSHPDSGWSVIVSSSAKPTTRSEIFKVPHHGSPNAHSDEIWKEILTDNPIAIVTPWNRGRKLPKESDIKRINSFTSKLYLTAPPAEMKRVKHERFVEKVMRDFGVKTFADAKGIGLVRCRKSLVPNAEWEVLQLPFSGP